MAYHLTKALYLWATSKEEYSILLLGLDNAGKTTLLSSIKSLYASDQTNPAPINNAPAPTVGQNVATIALDDMFLRIWDVGGQSSLRSHLWSNYYQVCHAIVFVVDSCDIGDAPATISAIQSNSPNPDTQTGRLEECRQTLEEVLRHPGTVSVPLLVLANKQDREDCVETVRIKEGLVRKVFEGDIGAQGKVRDSRVLPVSALRGDGVKEAVEWVRTRVRWNRSLREPVMKSK